VIIALTQLHNICQLGKGLTDHTSMSLEQCVAILMYILTVVSLGG